MDISYTYRVIRVEPSMGAMEVLYSATGYDDILVGTAMPTVDQTVEQVVQQYAPIHEWRLKQLVYKSVDVGTEGTVNTVIAVPTVEVPTLETAKAKKIAEIAAWRFGIETGGIIVNGATIQTDRESQATLTGALVSVQAGLITSINWKSSTGAFVTLSAAEITAIASAVAQHVQASFDAEKAYVEQVNACTTIEQVNAIMVV